MNDLRKEIVSELLLYGEIISDFRIEEENIRVRQIKYDNLIWLLVMKDGDLIKLEIF